MKEILMGLLLLVSYSNYFPNFYNLKRFEVESFKKELIDVGFLNAAAEKFTFKKESEKEGKTLMIDYDMFVICAEKN